jgi:hypothetical protein
MLRSLAELHGYTIHATDGDIGTVHAFFFDATTWAIRYLVVDTGAWLPGSRVLISPIALGQPDWEGQWFPVKLTTEQVRNSPDNELPRSKLRGIKPPLAYSYGPASLAG